DVFHHMRAVEADWTANLAVDWAQNGAKTDADADAAADATAAADAAAAKGAAADRAPAAALAHSPAKIAGPPLRAGFGNATSIGRLSVPACWPSTTPGLPASTIAEGSGWAVPTEEDPITAIPGAPGLAGAGSDPRVGAAPRYGFKPVVMPNRGLFSPH
ncbi:MAG: PE/PPE C-terminal domain-containing protein, partial [Mycobacteriaceae bacterium]|nr:PE/PPE C-terminal domain-containing protein [Mycobacteriaceae bacterium]